MKHHVAVILICSLAVAGSALADDLNPPPWQRGMDGTTWAAWEFSTPDPKPMPDAGYLPYGPPDTTVWTGVGQQWWDSWEGRQGVWPLSGAMEMLLFNRPEPLPYKDIQIQITWMPQVPRAEPVVTELMWGGTGELIDEIPLSSDWTHSTYMIHLEPNPDMETVWIEGSIMVDEVVIDTICIPEPMTLSLLALGALALGRKRR